MPSRSVPQPPFPRELLADLHADNLPAALRDELWPAVRNDPAALQYLHELDDVNAHLRALGADETIVHRMPDDVADRMFAFVAGLQSEDGPAERLTAPDHADPAVEGDGPTQRLTPFAALPADDGPTQRVTALSPGSPGDAPTERVTPPPTAAAASDDGPTERLRSADVPTGVATVTSLTERRHRRLRVLTAAAAVVAVVGGIGTAAVLLRDDSPGTPTAAPSTTAQPGDELSSAAMMAALGKTEVAGRLQGMDALQRCVAANDLDRAIVGATDLTYRGTDAVLILLSGPQPPTITALVVGPGCTTGDPQRLTLRDIG
ncbi:hypothetical protein [Nocardia thailandica]